MKFIVSFFLISLVLLSNESTAKTTSTSAPKDDNCVSCHQQAVSSWQQSDHAKAMSFATEQSVLGDFKQQTIEHYTQKAVFYKKEGKFYIDLTEQANSATYEVKYTFGHYPLQQYLVEATNGKLQVFPFAWDSQPESLGGQRWYPNYQHEDIQPNDRLHWQQPLQNWNGMCADCHSDGLKRNYDAGTRTFNTQWDNINVGCQSCHGNMRNHTEQTRQNSASSSPAIVDNKNQANEALKWILSDGQSVARLTNSQGKPASTKEKQARQQVMDTCFSCHALRAPLTDGIEPDQPFLDQFSPSLLNAPLYHADGQIKEEVYVYGSFLQSKMFAEGVTCLDCHDAHTMKVKTLENGLCLQCHTPEKYQQTSHTGHDLTSEAGQCVTCHMPETTYMGVDARRDHSFKVPVPANSTAFDSPNVCSDCHQDQTPKWAQEQIIKRHGQRALPKSEKTYMALIHGEAVELSSHLELINDSTIPEIKRATAISLLGLSTSLLTNWVVKDWIDSDLPLMRLAVARVGNLLSPDELQLAYASLLNDKYRAIRVAAAEHLVGYNLQDKKALDSAVAEFMTANSVSSWRGEGNLNRSLVEFKLGKIDAAIGALKSSIEVDPYFEAAYINLTDLYRSTGQRQLESKLYAQALEAIPNSASLHYAFGMHLVRAARKADAIDSFARAMKLDSANEQYVYLYVLALDSIGQTHKAIRELKRHIRHYQRDENLKQLGLSLSQKVRDRESFEFFKKG